MTACDRLKLAKKRLTSPETWTKKQFRGQNVFGARSYCLVGALCTEHELDAHASPTFPIETNLCLGRYRDYTGAHIYAEPAESPIPGLKEAFEALGFRNGYRAYEWNDRLNTTFSDVTARLDTALAKTCPAEEKKDDGEPTGA